MGPVPPPPMAATPGVLQEIGFDQKLGEQVPLDLAFKDETGKDVRLGDYFGKKPVVLSLVYYECPMLCTISLNGLAGALEVLSFVPGQEFEVLTVSFDPDGDAGPRRGQEEGLHDPLQAARRPTRAGTS